VLIPFNSSWRFRKGTNEVSTPNSAWRATTYDDSAWTLSPAPFHYGENLSTGTLLSDMRGRYTCIFLRHAFVITNVTQVLSVQLQALYDDGFVAWINGTEVARARVMLAQPVYTNVASAHEANSPETFIPTNAPASYLVLGTNVLAVQAFNQHITNSSDFRFDGRLQITQSPPPDTIPPAIFSVSPSAGAAVGTLTQIAVVFTEPVSGVDAEDLLINGLPASAVLGGAGTNTFTFTFTQPAPGPVSVTWSETHEITDFSGGIFNAVVSGATWSYTLADAIAPLIAQLTPVADAQVSRLTQIEVTFTEPVLGVNAADLQINGQPATNVAGTEAGPYVFQFPQPPAGTVQFSWAADHGITDAAATPNAFAGGNWTVTLNPGVPPGDVIINEFVAANLSGLRDEDGEPQDWIELYNRGATAVNLLGWSLTDDPDVPGKWTFPSYVLNPGQYAVVFASQKDRRAPVGGNKFHTNFKLNNFGEYLALFNAESPRVAATEFTPQFPEQRNNYSYGWVSSNDWRYFQTPTPGAANGASDIVSVAPMPHFSVERGFFNTPFDLLLTSPLTGATIRYTTDGSEPTDTSGIIYSAPVHITNTTILRAVSFASGCLPSRTRTHSYIYLDTVITQPNNPPGFPDNWGTYTSFSNNIVPADYEMDLDPLRTDPNNPASAIDPAKLQRLKDGLRELPVVSIVMNMDEIFNPSGFYHTPNITDKTFPDQPCSVEMVLPDGTTTFTVAAGLSAHGNASREPRKNPKHGFKLTFKGEYGESSLHYRLFPDSPAEEFDDLIVRADFGSSWRHQSDTATEGLGAFQRTRATRTRDAWWKDTMRDMGQLASHSRYCHLFINGLYWGTYDFSEQPTETFAANYYGGTKEDFDIYEQGALRAGTSTAYSAMTGINNLALNSNYELMKQYLDVIEFIDYTLLHFLVGAQDWGYDPTKNWYAIRKRVPGGLFKYIPWDGENLLLDTNINQVTAASPPSGLHPKLDDNAQYRLDFADRVHKHMVAPGGALTPAANITRWNKWLAVMDKPIVAESCRWGDYRRDVHNYPGFTTGAYVLYTRENQWLAESNRIVGEYLPRRTATVLSQLRAAGLYPNLDAPEYRQNTVAGPIVGSSQVGAGFVVVLSNPSGAGTIYYTTNGADPRVYYSGAVSSSALAYTQQLTLGATTTLQARVLNGNTWSALNEATFTIGELGLPLSITEIMYNPVEGDVYEYLELQNIGALPLDIGGFSFQGITFVFPEGTIIAPGAVLLLASSANPAAFATRYPSAMVFGYFGGSLSNGGERLALLDRDSQTVIAVHYDDEAGWPAAADGGGYSLEIIDPQGDPNAPANWRASTDANGTPGLPPVAPSPGDVVINEIMADNVSAVDNAGAFPDWVELHNRGSNSVNLANWSLTDNSAARKYIFPDTPLPAGDYLVVWCDTATNAPGLHTGFALDKSGETLSLFDAATNRVDAITFGLQLTDYTVGRVAGEWQLTLPTPKAENVTAALASPTNLAINEWLAKPAPGGQDWLELFNRSSNAPVSLRGLYLATSNSVYHLRSLSFVAPRGYTQLFAEEQSGADQLEFKLPAVDGMIALYDEAAIELDRVTYGPQTTGVSEGRLPDGAAAITAFAGSVSPGASNYVLAYAGPVLNELLARNDRAVVSPWGNCADFVELFNPGGSAVSLDGMALGGSEDIGDAWMFPAGASIPAGGYLLVWCDGSHAASTDIAESLNTGFSLSGESGDVCLFNPAGQAMDQIGYGVQMKDQSIGRSGGTWRLLESPTPGTNNSAAAALGSVNGLRFNEWMAAPLAGADWFELYNTNSLPVDLGGLYLSDNPSVIGVTNTRIAPLCLIGAGHWVKFIADGTLSAGRDHANFSLDQEGGTLRLCDTNLILIDLVDYGLQSEGVSEGRLPDGTTHIVRFAATPTPGDANYLPLDSVVINEVLTHTDPPLEDAVELFNPTTNTVNVGGWYLSDSPSDFKRYRIAEGTTIPAGGYRVFYQNQFGPADGETDTPPLFSFNSTHGDAVYLSEADAEGHLTGYRAFAAFGAAANGVSFGRYLTSVGVDFVAMSQRTFGVDNPTNVAEFRLGAGASNAYPLVGPVVINEIMYHPPPVGANADDSDEEFIELHNISDAAVSLFDPAHPTNVWRLAGAVTFDFPTNTTIPAGGFLLVVPFDPVADPMSLAAFRMRYGVNGTGVGPYSGRLDNAGETVELWRPDAPQSPPHPDAGFVPRILVERVAYSDESPWPANANGGGASLQRIVPSNYGNDPANWKAALPTAGRAEGNLPAIISSLQGRTLYSGESFELAVIAESDTPLTYQWFFNDTPILSQTDTNLVFASVQLTNAGSYRVQVANTVGAVLSDPAILMVLKPPSGLASLIGNGTVRLSFLVLPGRSYQVEYKNRLEDSDWTPLHLPVLAAESLLSVDDNMGGHAQRFYRLIVLP
jgi:hypothetical protein